MNDMKPNPCLPIHLLFGFLYGSILLILFSMIQKIFIGVNFLMLKGYIVPFVFGGAMGSILALYIGKINCHSKSLISCVKELEKFFEIDVKGDELSVQKWAQKFSGSIESTCHIKNQCNKTGCLAYKSECGRCWLQVGTLCGGKVQHDFLDKREVCTQCEFYKDYVGNDIVRNVRELTYSLIQNLFWRKQQLKEALEYEQKLTGALGMAGAVCHEVGQPLQSILICTNLLRSNDLQQDKREEILELLLEQSHVLQDLCGKLKKVTSYSTKEYLGCSEIVDLEKATIES